MILKPIDPLKNRAATMPQPAPKEGDVVVSDALVGMVTAQDMIHFAEVAQDVIRRGWASEARYGSKLKTHNGRNADVDEYQELLDAIAYKTQAIIEETDEEERRERRLDMITLCGLANRTRLRLLKRGLLDE
jgi:hypothetical protein